MTYLQNGHLSITTAHSTVMISLHMSQLQGVGVQTAELAACSRLLEFVLKRWPSGGGVREGRLAAQGG